MRPTALVYSSHDRCEYIHREFIIKRALESSDNKTIFHLPMSEEINNQHIDYGKFSSYYELFRPYGLQYYTFYWSEHLKKEDAGIFFQWLWESQVVVLGGGESFIGFERYNAMGEKFYNDRGLFKRILHERQDRGLMTAGFSAGADELGEYLTYDKNHPSGYGLAKNIVTTLHIEPGKERELYNLSKKYSHCMAFGLPNDSALGVDQGYLQSGNIWQVIWFIIDCSWDRPEDAYHIKTRQGVRIEHYYPDGRHWTFNGGDMMIRIMSPDNKWQTGTIINSQGAYIDYWTQEMVNYASIEEISSNY
jgi:hypothetical protein